MPATRRLAAFLLLAALVLTGCGGGHTTSTVKLAPPSAGQSAMGSVHPPGWGAPVWGKPRPRLSATAGAAEQYDTTTPAALPSNPSYLAGYTSGLWPNYLPLVKAYPRAKVKSIAVTAGFHAMCLDAEPGDASPSQVVAWVKADLAAGFSKPCVYSSLWEFTNQIRPLLAAAGISRSSIWEWDADYMFVSRIDPTFDCTQWTDKALGRNLDESTCSLAFLGVTPAPPKPPVKQVCFGPHPMHTPGCVFVQREVAAWRKQAASDLANAARVTKNWS
jgi:hypothetical protein